MYKIADLNIEVSAGSASEIERFKAFETQDNTHPDFSFQVQRKMFWKKQLRKDLRDDLHWETIAGQSQVSYYTDWELKAMMSLKDQRSGLIKYKSPETIYNYTIPEIMIGVAFRTMILNHMGVVLHCSALKYKNQGIVFSAPSGTGKSTHTQLWIKHREAEVINDDSPAIRMFGNEAILYGTPWSGSTQRFTKDKLPLKAIVILQQHPTNEIVKLKPHEVVSKIMPRMFLPYHDSQLMEVAMSHLEKLIQIVPVYLLKCTPEIEAMELVEKCLEL